MEGVELFLAVFRSLSARSLRAHRRWQVAPSMFDVLVRLQQLAERVMRPKKEEELAKSGWMQAWLEEEVLRR